MTGLHGFKLRKVARITSTLTAVLLSVSAPAGTLESASSIGLGLGPAPTAHGQSALTSISADGRYVLFASNARDLIVRGTNQPLPLYDGTPFNAFLRDRVKCETILLSAGLDDESGADGHCVPSAISTNAQYVLMESSAGNLVLGDTNGVKDVFFRDLASRRTVLVSAATNGTTGNGPSYSAVMTPDGRFVAFASEANNLVPDDTNGIADIFLRDIQNGTTRLVSVGAARQLRGWPPAICDLPAVSADGRYVGFLSSATGLVAEAAIPASASLLTDVYLRDMETEMTIWASSAARLSVSNLFQRSPAVALNYAMSADGRYIAYEASGMPPAPAVILRFDRETRDSEILHTNATASGAYDNPDTLAMSNDGGCVAFTVRTNQPAGKATALVLWDASSGTRVVSKALDGSVPAFSHSELPALDSSGRFVAFVSDAPGLTTNSVFPGFHCYIYDRLSEGIVVADTEPGTRAMEPTSTFEFSSDVRLIAYEAVETLRSTAAQDVFAGDLSAGTNELVSARERALPCFSPSGPSELGPGPVSADGRQIAFSSWGDDLVPNDTNRAPDIFVRDTLSGSNILVSANTNGMPADGISFEAALSGDGRYVAFTSQADDLVAGDRNQATDVVLRDLQTGVSSLVSVSTNGASPGNKDSYSPVLSSDGRYVVFRSKATDLAPLYFGSMGKENLFLRDVQEAKTWALTTNGTASALAVTPDGAYVAFVASESAAPYARLYVWDAKTAERVYTNSMGGFQAIGLSPDGRRLAWFSNATSTGSTEFRIADRAANTNWVFGRFQGAPRPGLRFSADGRFLAYAASPSYISIVPYQVYVYDVQTGSNRLITVAYGTTEPANGASDMPDISPDGRFVAFRSMASNLVPFDDNRTADVFVHDTLTGTTLLLSASQTALSSGNRRSSNPKFSADGRTVVFQSAATDLVSHDLNNKSDIFFCRLYADSSLPMIILRLLGPERGAPPMITWPAVEGHSFQVQFKDSLEEPEWRPLPGQVAILGSQCFIQDPAPAAGNRFYRVMASKNL